MTKNKQLRLAIVNSDKCKPKKCNKECKKKCPPQTAGKVCIEIENIAKISEAICIGCSMCVKMCPFGAIQIVNLPSELPEHIIHRYGENSFRLYKMPLIQKNKIFGILGPNGIGKSTIVKILSGDIIPNFEKNINDKQLVINAFKGHEMHKYFTNLYDNKLKIVVKPQNIEGYKDKLISDNKNPTNREFIQNNIDGEIDNKIIDDLDIDEQLLNSQFINSSGGEQQRIICAMTLMKKADVYIFDEPTNYLDVKQRLKLAEKIRSISTADNYVIIIDHDITILDFIADIICIMFGVAAAYGVSSLPYATAKAINMFFEGYIRDEKMRFRNESYSYGKNLQIGYDESILKDVVDCPYPKMKIEYPNFILNIESGHFPSKSSMTIILGENGTGKSTFLKELAKKLEYKISYKPQYPNLSKLNDNLTVELFLRNNIGSAMDDNMFISDVINPLKVKDVYDKNMLELSGGEIQRVLIVYCLGKDAHVYLLDEPSASLDIEQRINIIKVLKRFIVHNNKIGFIVEHDITMALSLAQETNSQVIVFKKDKVENDIKYASASQPLPINDGMNTFLKILDVTFRKAHKHDRPRINSIGTMIDREQKLANKYYFA